jgi:hypothetical protein
LRNQRDSAAYGVVGSVKAYVNFPDEISLDYLKRNLAKYEQADREIGQFRTFHKGEI